YVASAGYAVGDERASAAMGRKLRPSASPMRDATIGFIDSTVIGRPAAAESEVITLASSPHGFMAPKRSRSVATLRAKPCSVTQRRTAMPIEATLRSPSQTPVRP